MIILIIGSLLLLIYLIIFILYTIVIWNCRVYLILKEYINIVNKIKNHLHLYYLKKKIVEYTYIIILYMG